MSKLHIKKGDTVYVNSGEDKGKTGRVLKVLVKEGRALVEGINMVSKSTKPNAKNPQGGIVKQEAAIHISNLNVVDPKTGKPTRVGRKESSDGRTFVRYAKRYHIDYSIQKDLSCKPPRYLVYFKAQDTDALSAAFKEYSASVLDKTKRPSVLAKLHDLAQSVANLPDKVRHKQEERGL